MFADEANKTFTSDDNGYFCLCLLSGEITDTKIVTT